MAPTIQRLGVLTSGGDAPGMNAAVHGVVSAALHHGIAVTGIYGGYRGLLTKEVTPLTHRDVDGILVRGGTFLRTARCPEFQTPEGVQRAAENARELGLDALVVIGGDGSFRGALELSREGILVVGIPGTIDNDIGCTDYTIGFDTAMNTAMEAIDRIRDTAYSHERCSIIEVMGRHAGYIAYHTAIATGAEAVLLPELSADFEAQVVAPLRAWKERGKRDFIIVAAEGAEGLSELPAALEAAIGIKPTYSMLGYIQRGGVPTVRDRSTAMRMGERAVSELLLGAAASVIAEREGKICALPMEKALAMKTKLSKSEIDSARVLTNA
ncbi:MAG: 6-phosphofructokinase [Clostridia bacterium]|nr:6-phosphofructokinase [Clostridia bacterium]